MADSVDDGRYDSDVVSLCSMADSVDDGRYDADVVTLPETSISCDDLGCEPCFYEYARRIDAVSYCSVCNTILCKDCHDAHARLPASSHHRVVRGSDMPKSNAEKPVKYPDCAAHPSDNNDKFCLVHGKLVCKVCTKKDHGKKCEVKPVSTLCKELSDFDTENLKEDIQSVRDQISDAKVMLNKNVDDIKLCYDTLVQEVDILRCKVISKLDYLFSEIKSRIRKMCDQQKSDQSEKISMLSDAMESLNRNVAEIDKAFSYNINENLFLHMQGIVEKVDHLTRKVGASKNHLKIIKLSFVPAQEVTSFLSALSTFGKIEASHQDFILRRLPTVHFPRKRFNVVPKSAKKLTSLNVKLDDDRHTCTIKGMARRHDGSILLPDYDNRKVKLIATDQKLVASVALSASPSDVCVIDNCLAVVPTNDKKLQFLDISDPGKIYSIHSVNIDFMVWSCAHYKGNLVVTAATKPRSLKMLDQRGKEKWSLSADKGGQPLFGWPGSVVCKTVKGTPVGVVSDFGKDVFVVVDLNKVELIKTIDLKGKGPKGLTVDGAGNLYVCCNQTREIAVWTSDLEQKATCLSRMFLTPDVTRILFTRTSDQLIVCYEEKDTIDVFQILYH